MVGLWTYCLLGALPLCVGDWAPAVSRRQLDVPTVDSFRLRGLHSLAILDGYLYINGGEVSQFIDGSRDTLRRSRPLNSTLSIPLQQTWTNSTVSFKTINNGDYPPVKYFALWVDDAGERLYSWGGEGPYGDRRGANDIRLWVFEPDGQGGGEWSTESPANPAVFSDIRRTSGGGYASCGNTGFYLGGAGNRASDQRFSSSSDLLVSGLVSFDMETKMWSNESSAPFNTPYSSYYQGRAVCATEVAPDPLLFLLGGVGFIGLEGSRQDVLFNNMTFYNPKSKKWHWQMTSGDIPNSRSYFCAVGAQGQDNTYEIFVYGGTNNFQASLSDIYVLSIPAFRWHKVEVSGTRRVYLDCIAAAGSRQMIVVGGMDLTASDDEKAWTTTDEWPQGLGVFDMHDLEWSESYDPDVPLYDSPKVVRDWYADGIMDTVPWNSEEVKSMFAEFVPPSSSSSSDSAPQSSSQGKRPVGAIVGGTIGGVVAVVIAVGAALFIRRRRLRRNNTIDTSTSTPTISAIPTKTVLPTYPAELDARIDDKKWAKPELDGGGLRTFEVDRNSQPGGNRWDINHRSELEG